MKNIVRRKKVRRIRWQPIKKKKIGAKTGVRWNAQKGGGREGGGALTTRDAADVDADADADADDDDDHDDDDDDDNDDVGQWRRKATSNDAE